MPFYSKGIFFGEGATPLSAVLESNLPLRFLHTTMNKILETFHADPV